MHWFCQMADLWLFIRVWYIIPGDTVAQEQKAEVVSVVHLPWRHPEMTSLVMEVKGLYKTKNAEESMWSMYPTRGNFPQPQKMLYMTQYSPLASLGEKDTIVQTLHTLKAVTILVEFLQISLWFYCV